MKKKVRKYIIIAAITIVLGILSFMMYQSYAYYKVNYTGNIINTNVGEFGVYDYAYTGSAQEFVVPVNGYYNIELWGASSGNTVGRNNGGYTKGIIYLEKSTIFYVYVGESGKFSSQVGVRNTGGWNGGGDGYLAGANNWHGAVGGGATDIRLITGAWNNSTSLRSRIMVAGGGGGTGDGAVCIPYTTFGGSAGGLIGQIGTWHNKECHANGLANTTGGAGGTQTAGYQFGVGETATIGAGNGGNGPSGGGGGYYGGKQGLNEASINWLGAGGGGGSSYISGYAGVNSVQETGGTVAQPLHTNNTIHYSGKYFLKGSMEAGVNSGDGKAKITYVGTEIPARTNTKLDNVRYIKSCSTENTTTNWAVWNELQVVKNGMNIAKGKTITGDKISHSVAYAHYSNITDGDISMNTYGHGDTTGSNCIYLDLGTIGNVDEIGIWSFYGDVKMTPTSYTLLVSADNTNWTTIHNLNNHVATSQGLHYTAWD